MRHRSKPWTVRYGTNPMLPSNPDWYWYSFEGALDIVLNKFCLTENWQIYNIETEEVIPLAFIQK